MKFSGDDTRVNALDRLKGALQEHSHNEQRRCPQCNSALVFFDACFWIFESDEEGWTIPLSFCSQCHGIPTHSQGMAA